MSWFLYSRNVGKLEQKKEITKNLAKLLVSLKYYVQEGMGHAWGMFLWGL